MDKLCYLRTQLGSKTLHVILVRLPFFCEVLLYLLQQERFHHPIIAQQKETSLGEEEQEEQEERQLQFICLIFKAKSLGYYV